MARLRDVLTAFEQTEEPLRVTDLAARLGVSPGALEGMIAFWVRKGRLAVVDCAVDCTGCTIADCPLKVAARSRSAPQRYVLVRNR